MVKMPFLLGFFVLFDKILAWAMLQPETRQVAASATGWPPKETAGGNTMAKAKKNEIKASNEAILNLPVTNSPRGMSILAQKISAVLDKPVTVGAQGKSWLKLVGLDKDDHALLYEIAPQVCAEMDAITRWTKGKDESIMAYVQGREMRDDIRAERGLTVDPETRLVSVDLAIYLGHEAARAAEKARKAADRASKPKKVNTRDALAQMLDVVLDLKAELAELKAEQAKASTSRPAKVKA